MKRIRVLLAEDHETIRQGLRLILQAQPDMEVVGEAAEQGAPQLACPAHGSPSARARTAS